MGCDRSNKSSGAVILKLGMHKQTAFISINYKLYAILLDHNVILILYNCNDRILDDPSSRSTCLISLQRDVGKMGRAGQKVLDITVLQRKWQLEGNLRHENKSLVSNTKYKKEMRSFFQLLVRSWCDADKVLGKVPSSIMWTWPHECLQPDVNNMCRNWAPLAKSGTNTGNRLINVFQELKSKSGWM